MKTRYFLALLKETDYVNKKMHSWFEYYADRWAILPIAIKYKLAINTAK